MMSALHESLDRRHTELLVAIRHAGHLGRAAESLSISASAASHRLREAERRLGVELTVADGRSLRLTPAAVHLAEVAEVAQASLRSAEGTARWMATAERPTVRIALDFYDTAPWYAGLVGIEGRSSDIDIVRVAYDDVVDSVLRRRADVGVSVFPADTGPGDGTVLAADQLVGIVRDDHVAARRGVLEPDDIRTEVYITAGDRPQHGFEHHRFFEPAGVRPHRLRKVESLVLVLRLMRTYGGITVQPRIAVADADLTSLRLVPLAGPPIDVVWSFALRPDPTDAELEICELIRTLVP
jgi:LysR family transcriptional regulator, regulator for metE and metH